MEIHPCTDSLEGQPGEIVDQLQEVNTPITMLSFVQNHKDLRRPNSRQYRLNKIIVYSIMKNSFIVLSFIISASIKNSPGQ